MIMTLNLKERSITTTWTEEQATDKGLVFTTIRQVTDFIPIGHDDTMEMISGFIYGRRTAQSGDVYRIIK